MVKVPIRPIKDLTSKYQRLALKFKYPLLSARGRFIDNVAKDENIKFKHLSLKDQASIYSVKEVDTLISKSIITLSKIATGNTLDSKNIFL